MTSKSVLIIGINSDIGGFLSKKYKADGWTVYGTYRTNYVPKNYYADFDIYCDLVSVDSVNNCVRELQKENFAWDLIINASGTMEPIGKFFEVSISEWESSFQINFLSSARLLHGIWNLKSKLDKPSVVFFAGGGTNSSFDCYSAYCISKIALIKITELLDSEYSECNFFCIGPGFVNTKIHKETLKAKKSSGLNYYKTTQFQKTLGTSLIDIYLHIQWCVDNGSQVSGRNLSTVHDSWRDKKGNLLEMMIKNSNFFKLRRVQQGINSDSE